MSLGLASPADPAGASRADQGQELRNWLESNGEAILGSRPCRFPGRIDADAGEVRLAAKQDALYIILLARPAGRTLTLDGLVLEPGSTITMLGHPAESLEVSQFKSVLTILLPQPLPALPAYTFKVTPLPKNVSF